MSEVLSVGAGFAWTREVARQWGRWTRSHLLLTLGLSALAFVVGWVWNTYVIAVVLEGTGESGTQTTATTDGHTGNGLFWMLLFSVVGGLITYAWSRGWRGFWSDVATLPRRFAEAVATSRNGAFAMLLWGVSVSLIISTLISSAVSLALGLVLLALAATPFGIVLNFVLIRLWRGLGAVIAPTAGARLAGLASPFMVMLGEAIGLFVDWMVGSWVVGLILGVASAALSMLLIRGGAATKAAVMLMLFGVAVAWQFVRVRWAFADDGGWSECADSNGRPCSGLGIGGIVAWLGSDGAPHVLARAAVGGAFATVGTAIGIGVGGAAAGLALAAAQATAQATADGQAAGARPAGQPPHQRATLAQASLDHSAAGDLAGAPSGDLSAATSGDLSAAPSGDLNAAMGGDLNAAMGGDLNAATDGDLSAVRGGDLDAATSGDLSAATAGDLSAATTGETGVPSTGAGGGSARPYLDLGDILPEAPDREEKDEGGEGPTATFPPQR